MHICERTHCDYSSLGEERWAKTGHGEGFVGRITYVRDDDEKRDTMG